MRNKGAVVCLFAGLACTSGFGAEEPPRVPTYTNEDLERVAPYRGETGVLSRPAGRGEPVAASGPKQRDEAYWRREAERLRSRLRPLRRRADELRHRLQEAKTDDGATRTRKGGRSRGANPVEAIALRLESLEAQIREQEDELHERARRERALPGWLR